MALCPDVCFGSRLCENSDLELSRRTFVSITWNKKRTALAGTVERRKERKQFCAFSARARFHTAWVNRVVVGTSGVGAKRSFNKKAMPVSRRVSFARILSLKVAPDYRSSKRVVTRRLGHSSYTSHLRQSMNKKPQYWCSSPCDENSLIVSRIKFID
jgi:hypothetical protein